MQSIIASIATTMDARIWAIWFFMFFVNATIWAYAYGIKNKADE
jgi:cbb3-type cytochrome oxidase subunit 3